MHWRRRCDVYVRDFVLSANCPKSFGLHIPDLRLCEFGFDIGIGCHLEDGCRVREYGAIGRDQLDYYIGLATLVTG